jgi:hypothetical protein
MRINHAAFPISMLRTNEVDDGDLVIQRRQDNCAMYRSLTLQ